MLPRSEELFFHPQHPAEDASNQDLCNWFGDIDKLINEIFTEDENPAEFFDRLMDDEVDDGGGDDGDMNSDSVSGSTVNGSSFCGCEGLSILVEHSRNPLWSETACDKQHSPVQTSEVFWWSTKDYPLQNIRQPIDPWKEIEGQILLPPKLVFGELDSVPESANLVNSCSSSIPPKTPYTPDTDHCYNKPKSEEIKCEPIEEESDSDSSGDDEVDIETVSDDGQKMCAMKFERTIRRPAKPKRYSQRENTPPVRIKGGLNKRETARAVSAMLKLKRTSNCKMYQQDSKTAVRTKRGRRPVHSLPVSPGSSRSNSDNEEPVVKRSMHNNMERMRRNQQRMALHCLRDRIPELKHNPKISKVKIINKAREYIRSLVSREREQEETIRKLLKKQMKLRKKVNYLLQT